MDLKKLGRIPPGGGHRVHGRAATRAAKARRGRIGYVYVHSAVDDHSRLAYSEVLADETGATSAAFWRRAEQWFRARGVVVERVMTDDAFAVRGVLFNQALAERRMAHSYCRPYRLQTNGKVERLNRTLLEEWASSVRTPVTATARAPARWLHMYDHHRPHTSLGGQPPISRVTNVPGHYS